MSAQSIPVRLNGGQVTASWWNLLLYMFGAGALYETSQTLSNNASATAVTGVTCDSASYRTMTVEYDVYRKTDTAASEVRATGKVVLVWSVQNSSWSIKGEDFIGDAHGITWTLTGTTVAQLNYATTNIAGANYVGKLNTRASTFNL